MASSKQINPLRTLPIEIRDMLYHLLLESAWNGTYSQAVKVLAALRADPVLYKEALAIFYKTNTFCLTHRNRWLQDYFVQSNGVRFMDTRVVLLASTLQKVYVQVPLPRESGASTGPINGLPSKTPIFDRVARIIHMAQNLTHLNIEPCFSNGNLLQWLALVCDLIGRPGYCPVLQKLEITWLLYTVDRYSFTVGWTIQQLNDVFDTPGRLEGAFTGNKSSWVWEHRGANKGKVLGWGNGRPRQRIVVSALELDSFSYRDQRVTINDKAWLVRNGYPYVVRDSNGSARLTIYRDEVDLSLELVESSKQTTSMWEEVDKIDLLAMKHRSEREQERGSIIHKERENDYVTKWLYDQGFECHRFDTRSKNLDTALWAEDQMNKGTPSQRGSEGELDYVPRVVDIDEFDTASRAPSLDRQPTSVPRQPKVIERYLEWNRHYSALPSDWSRADSDEGYPEGEGIPEDISENDRLPDDRGPRGDGFDRVDVESEESGNTMLAEDWVFCPGEPRMQITY